MRQQRSVFKTFVAPIIAAVALVPTVSIAVWEVLRGNGAGSYSNIYGLAIQYTSILILLGAVLVTAAVAYIARVIYFWRTSHDRAAKLRTIRAPISSLKSDDKK
jgi:hypothetical protein